MGWHEDSFQDTEMKSNSLSNGLFLLTDSLLLSQYPDHPVRCVSFTFSLTSVLVTTARSVKSNVFVACVAGRRIEGKSKRAQLPRPIQPDF